MALVVEDGTGLATAESYISVSDAETRLANLGDTTFAALATDALKEQALRKAANYLTQKFRTRWRGYRVNAVQALDWPRWNVVTDNYWIGADAVPVEVANANADLALLSLTDDLNPVLERAIVREKVGPLETEYSEYSPQAKRWPAIDQMLSPFLQGGGITARLVRL